MTTEELTLAIKKMHMEPGDVGLFAFSRAVSDAELHTLRDIWDATFPDNKCWVLPHGSKFGIVSMFNDDDDKLEAVENPR